MAKPTNAVKGFIRLTPYNTKEVLMSINNIATVRTSGEGSLVCLINSPFVAHHAPQDLQVLEDYEEVIRRISEASY